MSTNDVFFWNCFGAGLPCDEDSVVDVHACDPLSRLLTLVYSYLD